MKRSVLWQSPAKQLKRSSRDCPKTCGRKRPMSVQADYVIHEAAHIFQSCKCATIGLRETPR